MKYEDMSDESLVNQVAQLAFEEIQVLCRLSEYKDDMTREAARASNAYQEARAALIKRLRSLRMENMLSDRPEPE